MLDKRGYSLLELVVTIGVLMAISISVPAARHWLPEQRVKNVAWALAGDLAWAKSRAVAEGNRYIISFDPSANSYRIYDDNKNDGIDVSDLVKTRSLNDIQTGVEFGYIEGIGIDGQDIESSIRLGDTSSPVRQVMLPSGRNHYSGAIYLIPRGDKASGTVSRQTAIGMFTTGKIKIYRYTGGADPWR